MFEKIARWLGIALAAIVAMIILITNWDNDDNWPGGCGATV